jgi:hypothetical protein
MDDGLIFFCAIRVAYEFARVRCASKEEITLKDFIERRQNEIPMHRI